MNNIIKALGWAALIIAVAFAGRAELFSQDMARTLVIVLPILAVITITNSRSCRPRKDAQA